MLTITMIMMSTTTTINAASSTVLSLLMPKVITKILPLLVEKGKSSRLNGDLQSYFCFLKLETEVYLESLKSMESFKSGIEQVLSAADHKHRLQNEVRKLPLLKAEVYPPARPTVKPQCKREESVPKSRKTNPKDLKLEDFRGAWEVSTWWC